MSYFSSFFEKYFVKSVPCSFTYDGNPATFGEIQELGGDSARRCYARIMETERLRATLHVDVIHDSTAIEWWLDVTAPSEYDSDVIDQLNYCDLGIELPFIQTATGTRYPALHWAKGSRASETDFQPQVENLWPFCDEPLCFQCDFGRPSSGCMPYFNLQLGETDGCLLAIGWTGQWYLNVHRKDTDYRISSIEIKATMDRARFRVYAGETLSLPRMLVMPWEGVNLEGSFNRFRKLIARDLPQQNGKCLTPPICLSTWGGKSADYHKRAIDLIHKKNLGDDLYYWIDAGWFGAGDEYSEAEYNDTWYYNVGDWSPLPKLYPRGMEEVGEAASAAGLQFLLWYEFERTVSRHDIVKKHREYFIGPKLPFNTVDFHEGARTEYSLAVNLGNEQARRWMTDLLARHIEKFKMHCLRIDFNYVPLEYWRYHDSEDRWGVTEIQYVNGLYALLDELRERFPQLVIDNCASGGRRLDYRMMRRSIPLFVTDYLCAADRKDEAMQVENFTAARWMPVHGSAVADECSEYSFLSHLAPSMAFGVGNDLRKFDENSKDYARRIALTKRAQGLLTKDLHLLTGISTEKTAWFAYEAFDEETEKGLILAFRRENCAQDEKFVSIKGIRRDALYCLEDVDRGEKIVSGEELIEGYGIKIPEKNAGALIFFERVQS